MITSHNHKDFFMAQQPEKDIMLEAVIFRKGECHKGNSTGKEINTGANLRFTLTVLTIINLFWLVVFINLSLFSSKI